MLSKYCNFLKKSVYILLHWFQAFSSNALLNNLGITIITGIMTACLQNSPLCICHYSNRNYNDATKTLNKLMLNHIKSMQTELL